VPYQVELLPAAARQFKKLPENVRATLARGIDLLADDPRATGCEKLAGYPDLYRVRFGDYRFVFGLSDLRLLVFVVRVGGRAGAYEQTSSEDLESFDGASAQQIAHLGIALLHDVQYG
jgi:mRNA interferase RelE/StbE